MTFGTKLQKLRKENNMSQENLAEIIHVSRQAISKWEQGTAVPDTDNIVFLSKYFQVPIEYLLFDEYDEPSEVTIKRSKDEEMSNTEIIKKTTNRKGLVFIILGVVIEIISIGLAYIIKDVRWSFYGSAYTNAWDYLREPPLILLVLAGVVLVILGIVLTARKGEYNEKT